MRARLSLLVANKSVWSWWGKFYLLYTGPGLPLRPVRPWSDQYMYFRQNIIHLHYWDINSRLWLHQRTISYGALQYNSVVSTIKHRAHVSLDWVKTSLTLPPSSGLTNPHPWYRYTAYYNAWRRMVGNVFKQLAWGEYGSLQSSSLAWW